MTDTIYGQYREASAIMWRGYTLRQFMNQCYSNWQDKGHGKQAPVLYGDDKLNFQTISSCLSTQMPQGKYHKVGYVSGCYIWWYGQKLPF